MDPERQPHVAPKWQLRETLGLGGGELGLDFFCINQGGPHSQAPLYICPWYHNFHLMGPAASSPFLIFSFLYTRRLVMWACFGDPTTGREIRSIVGPSISEWFLACELNPQRNGAHDCVCVYRSMGLPMRLVMWGSLCNTIMGLCFGYILVHVAVSTLKKKDTLTQRAQ